MELGRQSASSWPVSQNPLVKGYDLLKEVNPLEGIADSWLHEIISMVSLLRCSHNHETV